MNFTLYRVQGRLSIIIVPKKSFFCLLRIFKISQKTTEIILLKKLSEFLEYQSTKKPCVVNKEKCKLKENLI